MIRRGQEHARAFKNINLEALTAEVNVPRVVLFPLEDFALIADEVRDGDPLYHIKRLLLMTTGTSDYSPNLALQIIVNIWIYVCPGMRQDLVRALVNDHFSINNNVALNDFVASHQEEFTGIDFDDLEPLNDLTGNMVFALVGISTCFIGRLLTPANSVTWLNRRMNAFARACGFLPDNDSYIELTPNLQFASAMYHAVSCRILIRRSVFLKVQALAASNETRLGAAFKITMVFLFGAEITNFIFIQKYIIVENPILLAWNELEKHVASLYAAYRKWVELGDQAPYCKMLLPSQDLPEFNRINLNIFTAIARKIAERDGHSSVQYYRGGTADLNLEKVVNQAMVIIDYYGGAITHATNAVDRGVLIEDDNEDLRRALHTGANLQAVEINDPVTNQPMLQANLGV